ncbi:MAG: phage protein GemA/Gp16 family protein [Deferribacterales bacterium]
MRMIEAKQITLIHVAKTKLGMDEDTYRDMLARFKVKSSKELTYFQATQLIDELKKKGFKMKRRPKNRPKKQQGGGISESQLRLIQFLADQYPWKYENGFELWLQKQHDKGLIDFTDNQLFFDWDAQKVIEKLKQMTGISTSDISDYVQPYLDCKRENPGMSFKDWKKANMNKGVDNE